MIDPVREAALKTLLDIEGKGSYSNLTIGIQLDNPVFTAIDRSFLSQLVYGTLKWKLKIDWIISQFSKIRIERISPPILNILRIGIFQLLFLDRVPASAACNESVSLAHNYGHRGSVAFVNAMLRGISAKKGSISYPGSEDDVLKYLSINYSYPEWIVNLWLEQFGQKFVEELLAAGNSEPPFTIRLSVPGADKDHVISYRAEVEDILQKSGVASRPGNFIDEALIIEDPSIFMKTEFYRKGRFYIQDEAAMLVSRILAPLPREFVIDVCSAPGGKTAHLAELMGDNGTILARDIHDSRLKLVSGISKRLGLKSIEYEVWDAVKEDSVLCGKADKVLVDAPCSGLGILRRKPEIKWRRKPQDCLDLAKLQGEVLDSSAKLLKKGGIMVYSTCTINTVENEDVIAGFLERSKEFRLTNDFIHLYPNVDGTDGFFIARMLKE